MKKNKPVSKRPPSRLVREFLDSLWLEKGLSNNTVIFKHALRNSLIPIITILAGLLPYLIGGSVIIETIFSIPGMGSLGFEAITGRDYPIVMAVFTISAVLTLTGILISDIVYSMVDPRITFDKGVK